jgi:AcrR family transcriptional regulator
VEGTIPRSGPTRDRLIRAAAELVGEVGYLDATIKAICKRAGVAIGTFYVNFKGKPDLFERAAPLAPRLELSEPDLADRAVLERTLERYFAADLTLAASYQEAARYDAGLRAREATHDAAVNERLTRYLMDARRRTGRPMTTQDAEGRAWLITTIAREAVRRQAELPWPVAPTLASSIWLLVHDVPI